VNNYGIGYPKMGFFRWGEISLSRGRGWREIDERKKSVSVWLLGERGESTFRLLSGEISRCVALVLGAQLTSH